MTKDTAKYVDVACRVEGDQKKQAVCEQRIPFAVSENTPNTVTLKAMENAEKGEDMYGLFDSVDNLMEALNK